MIQLIHHQTSIESVIGREFDSTINGRLNLKKEQFDLIFDNTKG